MSEHSNAAAVSAAHSLSVLDRAKVVDDKLTGWIDGWNPYKPEKLHSRGLQPVMVEESDIRRNAAKWFLGFFAVFLAWALWAPIDAGVTVQGSVSVLGNRKAIQHPTGGVVQEIMVQEGAQVQQGQVLLRINPLKSEVEMTGAELQYINLLATESRLRNPDVLAGQVSRMLADSRGPHLSATISRSSGSTSPSWTRSPRTEPSSPTRVDCWIPAGCSRRSCGCSSTACCAAIAA